MTTDAEGQGSLPSRATLHSRRGSRLKRLPLRAPPVATLLRFFNPAGICACRSLAELAASIPVRNRDRRICP